jgi:chromosome segregation and condensation protein ScpB
MANPTGRGGFKKGKGGNRVDARHDAIEQAIQDLAREGLIVDSGQRRWSERTRSYQIVWVAREFADPDRLRKNLN